jgi:hypothetical protein
LSFFLETGYTIVQDKGYNGWRGIHPGVVGLDGNPQESIHHIIRIVTFSKGDCIIHLCVVQGRSSILAAILSFRASKLSINTCKKSTKLTVHVTAAYMCLITHSTVQALYPKATFAQKRTLICTSLYRSPRKLSALGYTIHKGCEVQEILEQRVIRYAQSDALALIPSVVGMNTVEQVRRDAPEVYPKAHRSLMDAKCWTREIKSFLCDEPTEECRLSRFVRQTSVGMEPYLTPAQWTLDCPPTRANPVFNFSTSMFFHPRLMQATCLGGYYVQPGPAAREDINDFEIARELEGEGQVIRRPCYYTPKKVNSE